ncbi:MAG: aldo/keto reductase [Leeuwenhoekiella sp.]
MKKIRLSNEVKSSVLGFGCAPIGGSVDWKTARYALDKAFEFGVNHFDLARSYGYGDAEALVGKFIQDKKHDVVVASKFGIKANWGSLLLKGAKPMIRRYQKSKGKPKSNINSGQKSQGSALANVFLKRVQPLRSADMVNSLEKSLRKLNRDYLDYFFIHEPLHSLTYTDELLETAQKLKKQGKIKSYGLAYLQGQSNLHSNYLDHFDLLQFNNPLSESNYSDIKNRRGNRANIIFSPFTGGGTEMKPLEKLEKLLIDFPNSVILCSMFNVNHMSENVRLANSILSQSNIS